MPAEPPASRAKFGRSCSRWRGEDDAASGCGSAALCVTIGTALPRRCGAACRAAAPAGPSPPRRASGTISETRQQPALPPGEHLGEGLPAAATPGSTVTTASTSSGAGIAAASAGQRGHRRVRRLPVKRRPGEEPHAAQHPPGRLRPDGHLQPARPEPGRATSAWTARSSPEIYDGTITMWDDPAITALNAGTDAARDEDRAGAPLRQLRRHVPVHQLPVHPGPAAGTATRSGTAPRSPGRPSPARSPSGQRQRARTPARPRRAASPTTGSATCPRRWRPASARRRLANSAGQLHAAHRGGDPGVGRQLRVPHAAQRDDLDDQRPGRHRVPDRQLRVRRGQRPPARRGQGQRHRAFLRWIITTGNQAGVREHRRIPAAARRPRDARRSSRSRRSAHDRHAPREPRSRPAAHRAAALRGRRAGAARRA